MKERIPEPKECTVNESSEGELTILTIAGHISELDTEKMAKALDDVFKKEQYKIVFNMADVSYMTSSALGQIMRAFRTTRDNGGFIRIVNPQPLVADIFRVTKLSRIFDIFDDLESALK